ncbi:hypothetical protein A374_00530 [Fictibacillus macauensis ZFHKF-1]|uniref:Uncharacterized protein n=2 Tax=Fictibacillus TaxID=1329200 RepID=I8ANK7_9BACL|nr:hypothetical protein A374_00530 [Fictibacillus macauensis ZFHKF-1]
MAKMYAQDPQLDIQNLLYVSNGKADAGNEILSDQDTVFSYTDVYKDQVGNYWFSANRDHNKNQYTVSILDQKSNTVASYNVKGKPSFYEFAEDIIIACEGDGSKGTLYHFKKQSAILVKEWKVSGLLWEVEMQADTLYATTYIVEEDQAVLYRIKNGRKKRINLSKSATPTDILCMNQSVYISLAPILYGDPKMLLELTEGGKIIRQLPLAISPRTLHQVNEQELLIYELDLSSGKSEKIVYVNVVNGEQWTHHIPHSQIVSCTSRSLSLLEQESKTLYTWDHTDRTIVKSQRIS